MAMPKMSSKSKDRCGQICGDFCIQKSIGKGTFGQVYLVTRTDQALSNAENYQQTYYAMKMISIDPSKRRELEPLDKEIKILSDLKKFKHQNIVQYVECFRDENFGYIIMEYCESGTLYDHIRNKGVIMEHLFVDILHQIASGLDFLHSKHVLHRDVKSKNILLTGSNKVKIADFGVARETSMESSGNMSVFIGSPQYMSPEMLAKKPYDEKTDIWSLGCTCYEMGIGDYAFKAENIQQIRKLVENKELPPMTRANYCEEIKKVIMWMLQNESVNRPTAKHILDTIAGHTCKMSKSVAKVAPRQKEHPASESQNKGKEDISEKQDSGVSDDSVSSSSLTQNLTGTADLGSTMRAIKDSRSQQTYLQNQSNRYQTQIVRLLGNNTASHHVSKILRACHKYPTNYDKIKNTVKKYTNEGNHARIFELVLALKGVEEAISQSHSVSSTESYSTGT